MDISLTKLRQLIAVARYGSFSRAAADLNISQPALSRSIQAIEQRYGLPLFNRLGHGVEPTAAGAELVRLAAPLAQDLHVFESNLRLMGQGQAGTLAIGMTPLLASEMLAAFAASFLGPGSKAQLHLMVRPGEQLLAALRDDSIELFFYPETHIDPGPDIDLALLGTIAPLCVVRAGHPLDGRADVRLADLGDFPWGSSVERPGGPDLPSRARMVCDNYHILRDTLLMTDMAAICSRAFVEQDLAAGRLREIMVDGLALPPTAIYRAKLAGRMMSPLGNAAERRMRGYLAGDRLALAPA